MASAMQAALRRDITAAGLRPDPDSLLLLGMLRDQAETHLDAATIQRLLDRMPRRLAPDRTAALLASFVVHGLIGRLALPNGEAVYDTVAECHSHLLDEARAEIVDLQVSPETLAAIVTQTLAQHGRRVEVLLRIRRG